MIAIQSDEEYPLTEPGCHFSKPRREKRNNKFRLSTSSNMRNDEVYRNCHREVFGTRLSQ